MDKEYQNIFNVILTSENEGILKNKATRLQNKFYDKVIVPVKEFNRREEIESLFWDMIGEIKEFYFQMGVVTGGELEFDYFKRNGGHINGKD